MICKDFKQRGKISHGGWMLSLHPEELRMSVKSEIIDIRYIHGVNGQTLKRAAGPC